MLARAVVFFSALECIIAVTNVQRCSANKPSPLKVSVDDCITPPCPVYKGTDARFEIQFVTYKYITHMTTKVKATSLGITIPYELPADVKNVCINLMYDAYCPLYPTEDVTYLINFPIANYPEVAVKIEVYIVDQDGDIAMCFRCDLKVKKYKADGGGTLLQDRFGNSTTFLRETAY